MVYILFIHFLFISKTITAINSYQKAFDNINNICNNLTETSFEDVIFEIENAFYDGTLNHQQYKFQLDFHTQRIQLLAYANKNRIPSFIQYGNMPLSFYSIENEEKEIVLLNWAIFTYITDTTWWKVGEKYVPQYPMTYNFNDPFGHEHWENTMVHSLLDTINQKGNCFSLATLFYIFSKRLQTEASLVTAPQHIFIQHKGFDGYYYNIEIPTRSFPGSGLIKEYTKTSHYAVTKGTAMRRLDDKGAIALALVYLVKGFENKTANLYESTDLNWALNCTNLALQYDSLCLAAMLLKTQILLTSLDKSLEIDQKEVTNLLSYQSIITNSISSHSNFLFADLGDNTSYYSLTSDTVKLFSTTDPVFFALAIDPLAEKFSSLSPYNAMANNPITMIDPDGMAPRKSELTSMKKFMENFNGYATLPQIEEKISQLEKMGQRNPGMQKNYFLYSPRWGFIDFKHFIKSAAWTNELILPASVVLDKGEEIEWKQYEIHHPSAFSEEDLPSNVLGAYFADVFLESDLAVGNSVSENLIIFFTLLEISENPLEDCQCEVFDDPSRNADKLKRNGTYYPKTRHKALDREIDKSILTYIREKRGDGVVNEKADKISKE